MGVEPFMVSGALRGCGAALGKARLCDVALFICPVPRNWLDSYQVPKTVAFYKAKSCNQKKFKPKPEANSAQSVVVLATRGVYEVMMRMTERLQGLA